MRRQTHFGRARGFSLMEVMIVVAILGIFAALAAPNLLFEVQKARLNTSGDEVAAFYLRALTEAMVSRRCVRVLQTGPSDLKIERLNSFDCDRNPGTAITSSGKFLDGTTNSFVVPPVATMKLESADVKIFTDNTNGSKRPTDLAPGGTAGEVRFRPNGRIWSAPGSSLKDDDAIISVVHSKIPAPGTGNRILILVNGNGLTCVYKRGESVLPDVTAGDFKCP